MKVKCISQCQKDRKEIFVAGEIYDISEEMYNKNETTDTQVQALSGATVTSRAITRAVKGILFYDASGKEAGQYE